VLAGQFAGDHADHQKLEALDLVLADGGLGVGVADAGIVECEIHDGVDYSALNPEYPFQQPGPAIMAPETLEQITTLVRSGFYPKEILMEILCEEMYAPGELDSGEVSSALDTEFQKLSAEQASWPDVTDCDRLDIVFAALNERGIVSLQNAGHMQDDGYDAVWEAYPDASDDEHTIGYCFYHGQDMEGAVRGSGLHLAFGPSEPSDEETKGHEVGQIIKQELERAGFHVEWDGTFEQRILIPRIDWKRRLSDETS
jgi:hypothetical protein